jgi:pimeloyl-ACP methyl ester carboxylesterase
MDMQTSAQVDPSHFEYARRGRGSPLLFIHGLTFDRSTWEVIIERLADRFTCVAVDLPGHGGSSGTPGSMTEVALGIHDLLGGLGVGRPVVVGHSMGAAVAAIYSAHHPTRGLVMVDQAPYIRPFAVMLRQFEPALRGENFRDAFEPIRKTIGVELLPEPQRSSILARQRIDQDLVLSYWEEVLTTSPDELQARIDRDMEAVSVPVLAVFGRTIDAATRNHLLGHVSSAEIEEWDGLGHMVHLMDADRFANRLAEFANRCFSETTPL